MKWVTAIMVAMSVPISPVTVPAMAQHAEPTCPADAAPLPAELSGWASRSGLAAAADSARLESAMLTIGKAVDLSLLPTPNVRYALRPENPADRSAMVVLSAFRSIDPAPIVSRWDRPPGSMWFATARQWSRSGMVVAPLARASARWSTSRWSPAAMCCRSPAMAVRACLS